MFILTELTKFLVVLHLFHQNDDYSEKKCIFASLNNNTILSLEEINLQ